LDNSDDIFVYGYPKTISFKEDWGSSIVYAKISMFSQYGTSTEIYNYVAESPITYFITSQSLASSTTDTNFDGVDISSLPQLTQEAIDQQISELPLCTSTSTDIITEYIGYALCSALSVGNFFVFPHSSVTIATWNAFKKHLTNDFPFNVFYALKNDIYYTKFLTDTKLSVELSKDTKVIISVPVVVVVLPK